MFATKSGVHLLLVGVELSLFCIKESYKENNNRNNKISEKRTSSYKSSKAFQAKCGAAVALHALLFSCVGTLVKGDIRPQS